MKKKLTENISLKIMSVVSAVLVWLIVVNVDNPIRTDSYTITNVELTNQAYVTNQVCLPDNSQEAIRVYITGTRKILNKITASDIRAYADMQQAVDLDKSPVMVPITVICDGISPSNIEVVPRNYAVNLEDKKTQEFVISVSSGDAKPGTGYEIGSLTCNPEKIKITGPETLINKIDNVTATISNVEGKTENVTQETSLVIYDKNGEQLTDAEMTYLNLPKVTVTARLWRVRSNIGINAQEYTGEPAEGYQVENVVTVPDVISVAGSEEALANLDETQNNTISIPAEYIDISGADSDYETKVNITELLPEGIKLTSGSSEDVWIRANILPVGSHTYDFLTQNIEVKNLADDLQVTFGTERIELRIKETEDAEEILDESWIRVLVDLKGKEEGSYELPVDVELPEGYELVEPVTAEVQISVLSNVAESSEEE
ncbi:MAG: CdaR family protein [Eubacteriales bacterium]|nr:CdaR family protein [Eubacteriales bacterium]